MQSELEHGTEYWKWIMLLKRVFENQQCMARHRLSFKLFEGEIYVVKNFKKIGWVFGIVSKLKIRLIKSGAIFHVTTFQSLNLGFWVAKVRHRYTIIYIIYLDCDIVSLRNFLLWSKRVSCPIYCNVTFCRMQVVKCHSG